MNEQLQQALSELITKTTTGIDTASDFILAELPDVIQQMLTWHATVSLIFFIVCVICILIIVYGNYKQYKYLLSRDCLFDEPKDCFLSLNVLQILWIPMFGNTMNLTWLQIWIAPKVWLIEYAANLVK